MKFPLFLLAAILPTAAFANAGIFRGFGQAISLESTTEIQMVSETVDITLGRGMFPVDGGGNGFDVAEYQCEFLLKNLTDHEVSAQVGFPLSSGDNAWLPRAKDYDDSKSIDVVMRHKFIVGSAKCQYPVRYVLNDKEEKFNNIFLWNMKFAPKEELKLKVSYMIPGYIGLGSTQRKSSKLDVNYRTPCLLNLSLSVCELFGYVTKTGKSWSGNIESATFKVHLGKFEKFIESRGAFENDKMHREGRRKEERDLLNSGHVFRDIHPSGWKEDMEGVTKYSKGEKVLVWEYKNFQPGDDFTISYLFTMIPKTNDSFEKLLTLMDRFHMKNPAKNQAAKDETPAVDPIQNIRQDVADVVLEFYGIKCDNPRIADYLADQIWYPVATPLPIDEKLKESLLSLGSTH